jgi:chromosome segregation ATPase
MGVYGCSRVSTAEYGGSDKNPSQEAKVKRLEEDYRAVAAARDQFRQKLTTAEERQAQLQRQLDQAQADAAAEREALKAEIRTRSAERDSVATQYEGFRKNLKELIGQAESTLANPSLPTIPSVPSTPALVGSQPAPEGSAALRN